MTLFLFSVVIFALVIIILLLVYYKYFTGIKLLFISALLHTY